MVANRKMNILCVIAHPDDLELMAAGTIAKLTKEGHKVHVLTFTDGVWASPDGTFMRDREEALFEQSVVANLLGYSVENLKYRTMEMRFQDKHVCEVLDRIERLHIDTLICPYEGDLHHDHEIVTRITISASKRIKRILMGQVNHYIREFFKPNYFVDISNTWDQKIEALKCYKSEWKRTGNDWYDYLDHVTRYYGAICGVERAEGFVTKKFLYF